MAKLVVRKAPSLSKEQGTDQGLEKELKGGELIIGRSAKADFSLKHSDNASRSHAKIVCKQGVYFLSDMGSSHGTLLNGVELKQDDDARRLRPGDEITIAKETVIAFIDDADEQSTLPPEYRPPPQSLPPPPPPFPPPPVPAPVSTGTSIFPSKESARGKPTLQPVYLILDGSGSMAGESIDALKAGIAALLAQIKQDPACKDVVEVSIVFFGTNAVYLPHPLSKGTPSDRMLTAFKPSGLCALGAGILQAMSVYGPTAERRRPPLFFIALDGVATDVFDDAVRVLQRQNGVVVACELGELGDVSPVAGLAKQILSLRRVEKASCEKLMRWLGDFIKTLVIDGLPSDRSQIKWPALPAGIEKR